MCRFDHYNFNVHDQQKSIEFYDQALGLKPVKEKTAPDGSYHLVFLGDGVTGFTLELTAVAGRTEPYDLGEGEYHLAFRTDEIETLRARHRAMGCILREKTDSPVYFIKDPDGYCLEILPEIY